jgi:small conductance mechanosensitive channel
MNTTTLANTFFSDDLWQWLSTQAPAFALKALAALAAWFVGRWLIGFATRLFGKAMARGKKVDATLSNYLQSIIGFALNVALILVILDIFGVSTTSFAALLAGAGLAIGTAWGGLLTHFAAGAFMQVLRPYKVGDVVSVGGITGTVKELGLFGTTLITGDNVVTIMGNNKVFGDTIKNYSTLPVRRVDCTAKIAHSVDVQEAIARLQTAVAAIANVASHPAPEINILELTPEGPLLCVRPFTHISNYWQVHFDTMHMIVKTFALADYPVPATPSIQQIAK